MGKITTLSEIEAPNQGGNSYRRGMDGVTMQGKYRGQRCRVREVGKGPV